MALADLHLYFVEPQSNRGVVDTVPQDFVDNGLAQSGSQARVS